MLVPKIEYLSSSVQSKTWYANIEKIEIRETVK